MSDKKKKSVICKSKEHPMASRQWCEDCKAWRHGSHGRHHFCPGESA